MKKCCHRYLSADFQLFIVSPLLIYPVWKYGRKVLWTLPLLAFLSSILTFVLCLTKDLRIVMQSQSKGDFFQKWIYSATHARMGPWLIGITLGYIMFKARNKKIETSKTLNAFLWILSISTIVAIVVLAQPLGQPLENKTSLLANAFYIAFHRLFWSIAISWIIFACQVLKTGGVSEQQNLLKISKTFFFVDYQLVFISSRVATDRKNVA